MTSAKQGETQEIRANTAQLVSSVKAKERELLSDVYKRGNYTMATYKARGDEAELNAEGKGYLYLQSKLGFSQSELMKFIYYDKVGTQMDAVVTGFKSNSKLINTSR